MAEESKKRAAFMIPSNELNVMPFGLKNAHATFQKLMVVELKEHIDTICKVYFDDIIIF